MLKRAAIERLYRTHGAVVLRRARCLMGNDADAHEILQEVFASLLQRPQQFSGRSSPMTYLYRVTTNRCLNQIRDRRNRLRLLHDAYASSPPSHDPGQWPEMRSEIRSLLAALPDDLAHAAVYYYLDEMSQAEVAALMGCSRRHVGNLLVRLRDRIERLLPEEDVHA